MFEALTPANSVLLAAKIGLVVMVTPGITRIKLSTSLPMAPITGNSRKVSSVSTCPTDDDDSRSSCAAEAEISTEVFTLATVKVKLSRTWAAFPS